MSNEAAAALYYYMYTAFSGSGAFIDQFGVVDAAELEDLEKLCNETLGRLMEAKTLILNAKAAINN
jgi:ubiquinone biosynthesis protein Coq4